MWSEPQRTLQPIFCGLQIPGPPQDRRLYCRKPGPYYLNGSVLQDTDQPGAKLEKKAESNS